MKLRIICPKCKDNDFYTQHILGKTMNLFDTNKMVIKCKNCKWLWPWGMMDIHAKLDYTERFAFFCRYNECEKCDGVQCFCVCHKEAKE